MNGPTSFADLDRAISLFEEGYAPKEVSEQVERPDSTCRHWRRMWKSGKLARQADGSIMLNRSHYPKPNGSDGEPTDTLHKTEQDDEITLLSDAHEIRTVDDAITKAGIDPREWQVASSTVSSYEVTIKKSQGKGKPDKIVKVPMWKVQVRLRRIVPKAATDAAEILFERFKAHRPVPPKQAKCAKESGYMLEVDLFDHHFGKLAYSVECGESYDLQEAEALYEWGVNELLRKFGNMRFDHAVLPIGQDMFHVNNDALTTAAGTPQDTIGFLPQMFAAASMAVVRAVDLLLERIGSVEIVEVPGNHGPTPTWFLAQFLKAWYRTDPRVIVKTVDGYQPRKYVQWGSVMLGFTHGNEERHVELPNIMATEQPQMWANTKYREMHLGHYHKQKQTHFVGVDSHQGVTVRILQSLSATDRWHLKKGYVNTGNRACEGFAWHRDRGLELHAKASL